MPPLQTHAPGVPADYYRRIFEAEQTHWWYAGMRSITASLLGDRLTRPGRRVLDAGCGTGSALRWMIDLGGVAAAAGVDIGSAAVELARDRVPEAELNVAPLKAIPHADGSFDLIVTNDVLQHVPEADVSRSIAELRRILAPGGALLVRTNGARRLRRVRDDWRAYDATTLANVLEQAGFTCERVTYANAILSLAATVRGRTPQPPTVERHGIPGEPSGWSSALGSRILAAEARWLSRPGRTLPYGHQLFAVGTVLS